MLNLQINLTQNFGGFSSHMIRASSNGVPFSKPKSGGPAILDIPLEKIRRPLMRTRANDQEKVKDLMESIKEIGLQEPIDVLEVEGIYYEMVGGSLLQRTKKLIARRGGRGRGDSSEPTDSSTPSPTPTPTPTPTPSPAQQEETRNRPPPRAPHRHSCDEGIVLIEPDDTYRRRRGRTTCNDIQNLPPGTRVNIEMNDEDVPCNVPESILLSSFLGVIARDPTLCPLGFTDWRNPGLQPYRVRMLEEVESKFSIPPQTRVWNLGNIGQKWRNYKTALKAQYWDGRPFRTVVENVPEGIDPTHWALLVTKWADPREQERATQNTANARMQKTHHTMGRKSTVRARREAEVEDRLQLWRLTRLHKDGSWVSTDAKEKWDLACAMLAEKNLTPEDGNIDANEEVFMAVMGPEHPGRVRGRGFGVPPNRYFAKSTYNVGGGSGSSRPSDSQLGRHIQMQEEMKAMRGDIAELKKIILEQNRGKRTGSSAPPPEEVFDDDDDEDDVADEQEPNVDLDHE